MSKKISELNSCTSLNGDEFVPVVQNGETKKALVSYFQTPTNGIELSDFSITLKPVASTPAQPYYENISGYSVFKPKGEDTAERFYLMPNGNPNGIKSKFEMFSTDYEENSPNYNALNVLVYDDTIHIGSNKGGSSQNHKQIVGGKYTGSSLQNNSARTEYNINNTVNYYGDSHNFDTTLKADKFQVSGVNTAPQTATSQGNAGEIRFTSDYIYVCITTNTWKRTALNTF